MVNVIENLKELRKNKKLSQKELSSESGVTYTTLTKIEGGYIKNPTTEVLKKLAKALDTSIDALISSNTKPFKTLNKLEISKQALVNNFNLMQGFSPSKNIIPILKSNAYGHGIKEVIHCIDHLNFDMYGVDSYFEALEVLKHSDKQVLLIGSTHHDNFQYIDSPKVILAIQDISQLEFLINSNLKRTIHLKINTGMNRQGIDLPQLTKIAQRLAKSKIKVQGVFSHLHDADEDNPESMITQEENFKKAIGTIREAGIKPEFIHLENTAGSVALESELTNTFRLGLALYGYSPFTSQNQLDKKLKKLIPVATLKSTLINKHLIKKGERVGYGHNYIAEQDTITGTIPLGYNDYFIRKMSNKSFVNINGEDYKLAGNVSMNLASIELGQDDIDMYSEVIIFGNQESLKSTSKSQASIIQHAIDAETIIWELLVKLNPESIRRVVV